MLCGVMLSHDWFEPEAGKSATALNDILSVAHSKDVSPKRLWGDQGHWPNIWWRCWRSWCLTTSSPPCGELINRPTSVCLPDGHWCCPPVIFRSPTGLGAQWKSLSLTFNTIQPALLRDKTYGGGPTPLDYVTTLPQYVRAVELPPDPCVTSITRTLRGLTVKNIWVFTWTTQWNG